MTNRNDARSSMSANGSLSQVLSAMALEIPDTDVLLRIIDRVPAAVAIVGGPEFRHTLANAAYVSMASGGGRILGRTVAEVFPHGAPEHFSALDAVWRSGQSQAIPRCRLTGAVDGGAVWWEIDYTPLDASGAESDSVLIIARDVSSQVAAQAAAEAERTRLTARMTADHARFQALVESMPAGVLVAEAPTGRITYGNHRVEEILRHKVLNSADVGSYGEWIGWHPDGRLVAPEEWPLARALEGEVIAGDEFLYRRGDATMAWIKVSGAPITDASGKITGSVVALYDIDREKRAEAVLRGSEERVRKVIDSLFSFVCVTTPEGVLVEANRTALDAAGLHPSAVLGRRYEDTWWWSHSSDERARLRSAIDKAATGQTSRYDAVLRLDGDRLITVDFTISPMLDEAGRVTHLIPSAIDITGRKRAEQALTGALVDKDVLLEQKDMLLKEVNHRVKNSLQLVASLLNLQGRQLDDPRSRQAFQDAVSRVGAIAQVHEQLYKNDNVQRVEFGSYLRTLCTLYGGGGNVAIQAEPVEVPTDSAIPLGLLTVELLTNALKHAAPGSTERPVEIRFGRAVDAGLQLTVRDHGPGIAEHFLDPQNRRRSDSLGMRLIESLASQLDAALTVDNLDPGARWTLSLPASA
ncbi:histidine kinase [Skermanella stibiiresistens SB22]|uniref:histidine kinase n=1 Tax=Skermanella stibiiresistens SB22 TaxID=1385369 RepID=W9H3W1_9PROT|nr:PAS domain-containing protein [Skermanella stibiiresistens]EWY39471.1 histidine kinase [Skermanella stibiiresistens SB22]